MNSSVFFAIECVELFWKKFLDLYMQALYISMDTLIKFLVLQYLLIAVDMDATWMDVLCGFLLFVCFKRVIGFLIKL